MCVFKYVHTAVWNILCMFIYLCICMRAYTWMFTNTHRYTRRNIWIYKYIEREIYIYDTYTYICMYIYVCIYTSIDAYTWYKYLHIYLYLHILIYMYIQMYVYIYIYICAHTMYIYIHTQIHTHTHSVVLGGVGDGVSAGAKYRQVLTWTVLLISRGLGLRLGHTHSVVLGGVGNGVSAGAKYRQVLTWTVLLTSRGLGLRLGVRLSICSELRVRDWVSSTHFDGVSISGLDHNWY